jgi:hypothetical protein
LDPFSYTGFNEREPKTDRMTDMQKEGKKQIKTEM